MTQPWTQNQIMTNTERFSDASSFDDSEPGKAWPAGVTPPEPGDELYPAYSAALHGYELNGITWRFNAEGIPEPVV